jgi:hypothetical protein
MIHLLTFASSPAADVQAMSRSEASSFRRDHGAPRALDERPHGGGAPALRIRTATP